MQLFVLGMHRSGTSSVTRLLNMAGAYFGPEGMSNGADDGNPKGFWERRDVRAACDGLLQESGYDWYRVANFSLDRIPPDIEEKYVNELRKIVLNLDGYRPWAVKEPRLSLLFPLMRPLLELPVCIHVTREPLEVSASLERRNGFPPVAGLALWEVYTRAAFLASEGLPRLLIRYEDLMVDPVATTKYLVDELVRLGTHSLRTPDEREITAFITSDLHRARRSAEDRHEWMNAVQLRLADAIDTGRVLDEEQRDENGLADATSAGAVAALEALERQLTAMAELDDAVRSATELGQELAVVNEHIAKLEHDHAQREAQVVAGQQERAALRTAHADAARALRRAERELRTYAGSRTAQVARSITAVRTLVRGGDEPTRGPLRRALDDLARSRTALGRPDAS